MPAATSDGRTTRGTTKLTNCRVVRGDRLVQEDLWMSSVTGRVLRSQHVFYGHRLKPDSVIDLANQIVAPGFIDVQLNGAFGFDFSLLPEDVSGYAKGLERLNRSLVNTGVTSYLPTLTSQDPNVYHQTLPLLRPSGERRNASDGAESLGVHCEGPFLNPTKNGIHSASVLRTAPNGFRDLEECYGADNLLSPSPIRLITLAPELPGTLASIPTLTSRHIAVSIGHSEASYEEALAALSAGATSITHLFNAMRPLHHRDPGIFGVLGGTPAPPRQQRKPFFGVIADGVHLHPTSVAIAWAAHPPGLVLVSDAMSQVGLPDGTYDWTNGERIRKRGPLLTLEGSDRIAGSCITLVECVANFWNWTGVGVAQAIGAVTATPARMLGLEGVKGSLEPGADADVVVLSDGEDGRGRKTLRVEQVWKFGERVFEAKRSEGRLAFSILSARGRFP